MKEVPIKDIFKLLFSKKMMVLNLQLVQIGNSISYWTGLLTPIIVFTLQNKDIS